MSAGIKNIGVFLVLALPALAHCALSRFTYSEYHMGVDARITVYASSKAVAEEACSAAFERIAVLDRIMSDYNQNSELMRLCRRPAGKPVRVSPDLFRVLERAQEVSQLSNGAFDITVGPIVALWRKARRYKVLPLPDEIASARALVGWERVRLNPSKQTVTLASDGMKLDLGGIAKGYAADEAQKTLKSHGVDRALVEMGGDMVVTGPPPGAKGWLIRVPNAGKDLPFANCAISTSGDTEQFVDLGGKRYSHVVDPRTGVALTSRVEVTVIADNGLTSDPVSTAVSVLGNRDTAGMLTHFKVRQTYVRVLKLGRRDLNTRASP